MVAYPQLYDSTDTTLQTAAIAVSQDSGTTYGATVFHLFNDKTGAHVDATTLKGARIVPKVYNGVSRVSSGYPILDESWVQIRVSGKNNAGDSTFDPQVTGFVPVGPANPLVLPNIPKNCAVYLDVKIVVPSGAPNLSQELYLEIVYDESSLPLAKNTGLLAGAGILPDWRDPSVRRLRRGRKITAAGTAVVTITKGAFSYDGVPYNVLQSTKTLDQNDSVPSALTAGQSYIARLSQKSDKTVTVTKGTRAGSPAAPALPSGEINLGLVTVTYQAGGVSIINTGNIDLSTVIYGEYLVTADAALSVHVGAGLAITSTDQQPFSGAASVVSLNDETSYWIWLNPDGTLSATTTSTPPTIGSLLLATTATHLGVINLFSDTRPFSDRGGLRSVVMAFYGDAAVGTDFGLTPVALAAVLNGLTKCYIESVDVFTVTAGVGGSMKIDVKIGGLTIYTSSGTDDQRPVIADSLLLSLGNLDHEVNAIVANNQSLYASFDIISTHTTPAKDTFVILNLRLVN